MKSGVESIYLDLDFLNIILHFRLLVERKIPCKHKKWVKNLNFKVVCTRTIFI